MGDRLHEVAEHAELIAELRDVLVDGRFVDLEGVGGQGVDDLPAGISVVGPASEKEEDAEFDDAQLDRLIAEGLAVGGWWADENGFATPVVVGEFPKVVVVGDEVARRHEG